MMTLSTLKLVVCAFGPLPVYRKPITKGPEYPTGNTVPRSTVPEFTQIWSAVAGVA